MIIQAAAPVFSKYKYENNVVICKHNILGDRVAFLAWCIPRSILNMGPFSDISLHFRDIFSSQAHVKRSRRMKCVGV